MKPSRKPHGMCHEHDDDDGEDGRTSGEGKGEGGRKARGGLDGEMVEARWPVKCVCVRVAM